MKIKKRLVLIPTYNELENSGRLCKEILSLKLKNTDILFVDDNSPDGTGELLDKISRRNKRVKVIHRPSKNGIGSAHMAGINWAYKKGYSELVTMDCDFTHSPSDIIRMINTSRDHDVVVGSRYLRKNSLKGWNFYRTFLTWMGHFLTTFLLGMKYDASNAFRLYKIDKVPKKMFGLVTSRSYAFFLESLFILTLNNFKIVEVPIKLPPRTYGHSKMALKDIALSVRLILLLFAKSVIKRNELKI